MFQLYFFIPSSPNPHPSSPAAMPQITPAYISIGANRFSGVCDTTMEGLVAFGAGNSVAFWDSAVRASLQFHFELFSV
jgi:hypothetical protein